MEVAIEYSKYRQLRVFAMVGSKDGLWLEMNMSFVF